MCNKNTQHTGGTIKKEAPSIMADNVTIEHKIPRKMYDQLKREGEHQLEMNEPQTAEQARQEHEEWLRQMTKRAITVNQFVDGWRTKPKPKTDRRETVECPICGGKLHLHQASYNGHVRGACETDDCVNFME